MKNCPGCKTDKPLDAFYRDRSTRLGRGTYCRPCTISRAGVAYLKRKAKPKVEVTSKVCGTCGVEKVRADFWRAPASRDGLMPECKLCRSDRVRVARYGIPAGEYDRLHAEQQGACACCGRRQPLVVDHRHDDGVVRGLLCSQCNTALGLLGDDPGRVLAAAAYLLTTTPEGAWL